MSRTGRKHGGTGIYHEMLRGINRQGVFEEAGRLLGGMESKTCPCDFSGIVGYCRRFRTSGGHQRIAHGTAQTDR